MLSFIAKIFDSNDKEVKKLEPLVLQVNALEEKVKKYKDSDFSKKTKEFKKRIADGESLDGLLPEAFALVREASFRSIGLRHYDVQLMAASALSSGKIAEQKTGEGKTLSAVPALYLNSLTGKSVHLVTVNDYLARRDAGWMGPIFHLLGVSVSSLISETSYIFDPDHVEPNVSDPRLAHLKPVTRKQAYEADVVYGINSEFGFDYLRDNRASDLSEVVQRGYYFAIVDEVDSVLIDEARTPHIISAPDEVPSQKYYEYATLVEKLSPDGDYKIDEKLKTAHLTDHGIAKIEKLYGVADIYEKNFDIVYHLEAALKARTLFQKEKDYIVKEDQVILVDEFTGRLMVGRRLSEGLHQAIEAKENVPIQRESKTIATVSLQNYFRMYEKLAGMTGTAITEAEEFHKIYKLDVVVIPTNKSTNREDLPDAVYKTSRAKYSAVADEIQKVYATGQPILIGTTSIEKNEIISQLLTRRKIKHEVLNAKNHEREAEIISMAGLKNAVTVATNMAGRGVDIILGGEPPEKLQISNSSPRGEAGKSQITNEKAMKEWEKMHHEVVELGGLYVIGTERHESRRIDNQLRGRSGRQGDPGLSQFFVALDDDIMRLFGGDMIASLMTRFNMPENVPLQHSLVSRAIEQAQTKVEGHNFDIRKHLVQYDDVLNKQREIIYALRRKVLEALEEKNSLKDDVLEKINLSIASLVAVKHAGVSEMVISPAEQVVEELVTIIPFDENSQKQLVEQIHALGMEQQQEFLSGLARDLYEKREKEIGEQVMRQVERFVMLSVIDTLWVDHLDAIDALRGGIGLRGYAQKDPLVEYKNEAFRMFEQLMGAIDDEIVHRVYKVQVAVPHEHQHQMNFQAAGNSSISEELRTRETSTDHSLRSTAKKQNSAVVSKKLGRNDPCYCGSGKKFKKCHGA